jgi:hypothetical protein
MTFITGIEKSTLKIIWMHKRLYIAKAILNKKRSVGGITITIFKLHCRAIAIKTVWYWQKNIYEDKWNRREGSDVSPHSLCPVIFDKGTKNIKWRKDRGLRTLI